MAETLEEGTISLKEERSDHHARQGAHKPGDRAKKFSSKSQPKGTNTTSLRKARLGHFQKPVEGERTSNPGKGKTSLKAGSTPAGVRDEMDEDAEESGTEESVKGISEENTDAANHDHPEVALGDLLVVGNKKPRKPKGMHLKISLWNFVWRCYSSAFYASIPFCD